MTVLVKFCGLTTIEDVKTAVSLGVNAIGLVFYAPSPRAVTPVQAKELVTHIPPFTTVVALVVNMGESEIVTLAEKVPFDVLQFHGDESAEFCSYVAKITHKRWYKALRISDEHSVDDIMTTIQKLKSLGASAVLLDAYHPDKFGGTGEQFDWSKIPENSPLPIILAGGLNPDNIGDITKNQALLSCICGVDVSGGIEKEKGIKCEIKMKAFIKNMTDIKIKGQS